jgi:DNA-binding NarL/FixJ family response regulator
MLRPRILVGDDHSLVLEGIKRLLEDDFEVVGSADDGATLVREAVRLRPNLVLLDISMPILNGIDAARQIKKELPEAKLIFISMHANSIYVRKALEVGASAYVLKSGASEELKKAIATVRAGDTYLSPGLDREVIQDAMVPISSHHLLDLTSRQRQILQLIAEGKQNKEIASILFVSVRTVEFHRGRLMTKLGARSAAELTRLAIQDGLIPAE